MDAQQLNAPSRPQFAIRRSPSGVHKVTERQEPGYTIVGNHLAQHRELSGLAIGLGAYIQSLPEGAPVDIRTLAKRFPEGRDRIAAALRELEAYGYLERVRRRTDDGRMVTITISYNNPEATRARRAREAAQQDKCRAAVAVKPERSPVPEPVPEPAPAPKTPPPTLPQPRDQQNHHHPAASALLANLRREDPRLLLSVRDVHRLAPSVAAWLERGADPDSVRQALTTGLPQPLRNPAALIAHRLAKGLPPPSRQRLPPAPRAPSSLRSRPATAANAPSGAQRPAAVETAAASRRRRAGGPIANGCPVTPTPLTMLPIVRFRRVPNI
ncbi:helix-turn-helix domain-containing protein [Streptomyces sirii]|uniref:helix-turn-helix domain-containing protein n=1 Tax=Streptomyces sirii TaxID=3127701 RepID=UPI003D369718